MNVAYTNFERYFLIGEPEPRIKEHRFAVGQSTASFNTSCEDENSQGILALISSLGGMTDP